MPSAAQPVAASPDTPVGDMPAELLRDFEALARKGKYLDIWRRITADPRLPPIGQWQGIDTLLFATRLVDQLGDPVLGNRLALRAHRLAPRNPDTIYRRSYAILNKHGPLEALLFVRKNFAAPDAVSDAVPGDALTGAQRADHLLAEAQILAIYRDFHAAEKLLTRAAGISPDRAWTWVSISYIRECEDRYDDALAAAERACILEPSYRASIEAKTRALELLNRKDDSEKLLRVSLEHMQCPTLSRQLFALLFDRGACEAALSELDRAEKLMPLATSGWKKWFASRRCDTLHHLGRHAEAAAQARLAGNDYYKYLAEKLDRRHAATATTTAAAATAPQTATPVPALRRVRLPVAFVRQHHMTCAPATLAAISAYWQKPADHLALARAICYDGTPDHEERHWAESNGWHAREFRVTWESAVALLDRGCPFTLTTTSVRQSHLQAVVGYDGTLGTLLIRDPYNHTHGECIAEHFLAAQASGGPRGMVFVPAEKAALLDGVDLPDAPLYDCFFRLRRALVGYNREAALRQAAALAAAAPGHRLVHFAAREIAAYDHNDRRLLETTRALIALHPGETNFQLDETQCLQRMGHNAEARELLRRRATQRNTTPVHWREYAGELRDDARQLPLTQKLLRRALRRMPTDAATLHSHANLLWTLRDFTGAAFIYRLAACAGDKTEHYWMSFFGASLHIRETDACLALLHHRFKKLGSLSGQPARTLFNCHESLDRTDDGFQILSEALALRPDDGDLLLFAAEVHGRYGRREQAATHLAQARDCTTRAAWLRTAALIADHQANHKTALGHWREYAALVPNSGEAHNAIARLLAALENRAAALAHMAAACAAQPGNIPLHASHLEWMRGEPAAAALPVADRLLAIAPDYAWGLREKAGILQRANRHDEALQLAREAIAIAPLDSESHGVLGSTLAAAGRAAEAREACRQGLRLSLRSTWIVNQLMESSETIDARREALAFLEGEISRQPHITDACLRFREISRGILPPEQRDAILRKFWQDRPAEWAVWAALSQYLFEQARRDEAQKIAAEAVQRFPLIPALWVDLARIQSAAHNNDEAITSLRRALAINPAWGFASRQLALVHERLLQLPQARHVLGQAIAAAPLDPFNHTHLGDILWRLGEKDAALASLTHAIRLAPSNEQAWHTLRYRCSATHPQILRDTAAELTQQRPGDIAVWLGMARYAHTDDARPGESLAALDRAETLAPRNIEIHDLRVERLARARRIDEALAACNPPAFGGNPPRELQGRAAWVECYRGNTGAAIRQLRELLDAHPDYVWGWNQLTVFLWNTGEKKQVADTAARWSALAPADTNARAYLALAHIELKNTASAKDALRQILHVEPDHIFACTRLLMLQCDAKDAPDALETLRHIRVHLAPEHAHLAEIRIALMQAAKDAVAAPLTQLALASPSATEQLHEAASLLINAGPGWASKVGAALTPLLDNPRADPEIGLPLALALSGKERIQLLDTAKRKTAPPSPALINTCAKCIEIFGDEKRTSRLFWMRLTQGGWLRSHTALWGAMGYAHLTTGKNNAAICWLSSWRKHPDARPSMLHNLVHALHIKRCYKDTLTICEEALRLPSDHTTPNFHAWAALEHGLAGAPVKARAHLAHSNGSQMSPHMAIVNQLANAITTFQSEFAAGDSAAEDNFLANLFRIENDHPNLLTDSVLRHYRKRICNEVSLKTGSGLARLMARFRGSAEDIPVPGTRLIIPVLIILYLLIRILIR
jgi:tetratricopeptide (TPR) repeat protein